MGGGEDGQQVPNPRVDVCRGALEGGIAGLVGIAGHGRIGDAPVDLSPVVAEVRADLARPVTQGDHLVELFQPAHRTDTPTP